jgi:hypothetical protein
MIVLRLREAVIAALKEAVPGAQVIPHGGTFSEAEMKAWAVRTPALVVSESDVSGFSALGRELLGQVGVGIALVTAPGKRGESPDAVALALLPSVLVAIAGRRWGLAGVEGKPEQLQARNLYSGDLGAAHVALWGVSFRQQVLMDAGLPTQAELDEFLTVHLVQADPVDGAVLTDDIFNVRTGAPESPDPEGEPEP